MSERDDLLNLARMADQRGDIATAKAALMRVDAMDKTQKQPATQPEKPDNALFGIRIGGVPLIDTSISVADRLGQIPRAVGLATRYGIEGVSDVGNILAEPVRQAANMAGADIQRGNLADILRLPSPEAPVEQVVGSASRTLAAGGPFIRAGTALSQAPGAISKAVGEVMAARPAMQAVSAGSAGASGEAARQAGFGPGGQFTASLVGGLAPSILAGTMQRTSTLPHSMLGRGKAADEAADAVLARNNIDTQGMTITASNQLRDEVKRAISTGDQVDPLVLRRMADYAKLGATPTRGTVTLDPAIVTMEKNLAKIGANTGDDALQRLAQIQRENDLILTNTLNRIGAENADDPVKAGQQILSALRAADAPRKAAVDKAYQAVMDATGRYADLDHVSFANMANNALDEKMLGASLPAQARTYLNDIAHGKTPLNVNTMVQLDKRLSGLMRDAYSSGNGEAALAVKQVRDALQNTPISGAAGAKAAEQYQAARQLAANRFGIIEKTPALQAALDDVAPDKFVQSFIIGSGAKANTRDVAALAEQLQGNPNAMNQAKTQILAFLKDKALSGKADEVANFSPSAYAKALNSIGKTKLGMFFGKDEIGQLEALGRVASYEKFQPTGSAVNTSNTAATLMGRGLDMLAAGASRVPFGGAAVSDPLRQFRQSQAMNQATNLADVLRRHQVQQTTANRLAIPALYGLLAGTQ